MSKIITLDNLATFKSQCDNHYRLFHHSIAISTISAQLEFYSHDPTPATSILTFYNLLSGNGVRDTLNISGAAEIDSEQQYLPVVTIEFIDAVSDYTEFNLYYCSVNVGLYEYIELNSSAHISDIVVEV